MVASEQHLYKTIVLLRKLATESIHDYLFGYCPLVGILFKVLRIVRLQLYIKYHFVLIKMVTFANFTEENKMVNSSLFPLRAQLEIMSCGEGGGGHLIKFPSLF